VSGFTITPEMLAAAMREEPEDCTPSLREGDWITVPGHAQGTVWESGHVERITRVTPDRSPFAASDNGYRIWVGYGARESSFGRAHGTSTFISTREVGEIWRRRRVVRKSEMQLADGRWMLINSSEYEWFQIR
jgi:hypothetical protein